MSTAILKYGPQPIVKASGIRVPGSVAWSEPRELRAANRRMCGDRVGEYHLANGEIVWVFWDPQGSTVTNITVWSNPGEILRQMPMVNRLQAGYETEKLLQELEN